MRRLPVLLLALALLIGLAVLFWPAEENRTSDVSEPVSESARLPEKARVVKVSRTLARADWKAPAMEASPAVTEALALIEPDGFTVTCPAAEVSRRGPPRTYGLDGADNAVLFVAFVGEDLVARVSSPVGSALVSVDLETVGTIHWSEQGKHCELTPVEWVDIPGRIEGTLDPRLMVRGCVHGELVQPDLHGEFNLRAVRGSTCFPFAFVETDVFWAKGPVATVVADGGGIVLAAPGDRDREDPALQRERLAAVTAMFAQAEEQRPDPFAEALSSEPSPEVSAVIREWSRAEDEWTGLRLQHLEELSAPDADPALYREFWLGLF